MVVSRNVPLLGAEAKEQISGDTLVKALLSPATLNTPTTPLSPRLSIQTSIRRNYSITTTITVPGPIHTTIPAARLNTSGPALPSVMPQDEKLLDADSDPALREFQGDLQTSTALPSKSTLERIADLPVFDGDGKTLSFKSLYWSDSNESKKVMIIFIRHFFCGNCQEYLRTLAAAIPPSSLPQDTSIRIIGCGSHTLIPSYIEQTQCPYPTFADPSKRLYSLLDMTRTLSLGNKDPDYIHQNLVSGMVKSIAQGLKRIGSGDMLQAGDMRQVGGEFLFDVTGGGTLLTNSKSGNGALQKVEVTWCHRMKNTRDHAELPVLKQVLGLENVRGDNRRRRSEASWRSSGLARSLSNKRQSLSWSRTRRRSGSTGRKASHDPKHIHTVDEEARTGDGQMAYGHEPGTVAKI